MTTARSTVARPLREDHLGASTFVEKAWNLIAQGDFISAEKALQGALLLAPSERRARSLMGWALMRQGKLDEALADLDQVLAEDPMNGLARASLGYVCMRKGLFHEAQEHLSRVTRQTRDPKAALYAWFYLGMLQADLRNIIEAEQCFRRTISLAPNFVEAYYELGRAFLVVGETAAAEKAWRSGVSTSRFNVWGRRCAEAIRQAQAGHSPKCFS